MFAKLLQNMLVKNNQYVVKQNPTTFNKCAVNTVNSYYVKTIEKYAKTMKVQDNMLVNCKLLVNYKENSHHYHRKGRRPIMPQIVIYCP